ncbi:MAG: hypothetical protein ACOC2U_04425, partial [bacterium]
LGFKWFKKLKDDNSPFAYLILSLSLWVFSSLLLPMFGKVQGTTGNINVGNTMWLYDVVITKFESLRVLGDLLAIVQAFAVITMIISLFRLLISLFTGGFSTGSSSGAFGSGNKKNPDILKARKAIERINKRIKKIDNIFSRMKNIFTRS